jgi:hypothetical protein
LRERVAFSANAPDRWRGFHRIGPVARELPRNQAEFWPDSAGRFRFRIPNRAALPHLKGDRVVGVSVPRITSRGGGLGTQIAR